MMVLSKFNSLPPELIVEIGDYLDACDLYHAFYGLNYHINTILDQQCYRLHVNFVDISKITFDLYCKQILPHINARITSFTLSGSNSSTPGLLSQFLMNFNFSGSIFLNLESFKLIEFTKSDIESLTPHFSGFIHLKNLSIGEYTRLMPFVMNIDELYQENIILPISLRCLAFPYEISDQWIQTSNGISLVEQLHIHYIHINLLAIFLQRFPHIKRLTAVLDDVREPDLLTDDIFRSTEIFHTLRYLNVNIVSNVVFDHFALFLGHTPQLHTLIIEALNPDLPFLEAHRWETILPVNLSSFRFNFAMSLQENPDHLPLFKAFQNNFWISRNWFVRCHLRDHGQYFRLSTTQSSINTILYWPDDEILLDSTLIDIYPHVTHIELWWNLSKSTQSICPHVRSIQFYGANNTEIEPIHPNVCDLLQTPSFQHIIINHNSPISPTRLASLLVKSSDHVHILTCTTDWLHSLFETRDYEWICLLMTMRIRKLILNKESELILSRADLISFTRSFLNLQELTIRLLSTEEMFFILNILRQLTMANIELPNTSLENITDLTEWIQQNTIFHNFTVQKQIIDSNSSKILLWIGSHHDINLLGRNHHLYSNHPIIKEQILENYL
ncbi:hypothetical protein I4U23_006155 [Adineta vaga]|nr:hypothetical protein I4U23_006155 [Adineta vaga]